MHKKRAIAVAMEDAPAQQPRYYLDGLLPHIRDSNGKHLCSSRYSCTTAGLLQFGAVTPTPTPEDRELAAILGGAGRELHAILLTFIRPAAVLVFLRRPLQHLLECLVSRHDILVGCGTAGTAHGSKQCSIIHELCQFLHSLTHLRAPRPRQHATSRHPASGVIEQGERTVLQVHRLQDEGARCCCFIGLGRFSLKEQPTICALREAS
mmetsp:Transcript_3204/g.7207  ORF Transcript_3204/g.7207 Transcript_3204/m.7207 type:complete len:208 (+) Transcript_3204:698-1321(+)